MRLHMLRKNEGLKINVGKSSCKWILKRYFPQGSSRRRESTANALPCTTVHYHYRATVHYRALPCMGRSFYIWVWQLVRAYLTLLLRSSSSLRRRSLYSLFFTHSSVRLWPFDAIRACAAVRNSRAKKEERM